MAWFILVISIVVCYFIGSINGAVIISTAHGGDDVRKEGSGNAGMTNMIRSRGIVPGLCTFAIDTFKGTFACLIAKMWVLPYIYSALPYELLHPEYSVYYCAIACIIGHVYPVWFGFKGGKGVSTTLGIGLVCNWQTALVALSLFIVLFVATKIVSVGSLAAAVSLPILNFFFAVPVADSEYYKLIQVLLITIMSLNIIISHRANIGRLIRGEEKKLTVKKKEKPNEQ